MWFFYVLLFLMPLGTRKVFFTPTSIYFNTHLFYNSLFLYLTDLIIFILIITWFFERGLKIPQFDKIYKLLFIFWLVLAISTIFSREKYLGAYEILKILEFGLLFAYIRENVNFSREKYTIFWLILAGILAESLLAIVQFINQSSVGLRVFGEEFFRPGLRDIAQFFSSKLTESPIYSLFPQLQPISGINMVVRGYGTLPHPNVLAGLLLVGILANIFLLNKPKKGFSPASTVGGREIFLIFSLLTLITGLVVTFSRIPWVIILASVAIWIFLVFVKIRGPQILAMRTGRLNVANSNYFPGRLALIIVILLAGVCLNFYLFGGVAKDRIFDRGKAPTYLEQESLTERAAFNSVAIEMLKTSPITGVGLKNYVTELDRFTPEPMLPRQHQPVHNIYLLIAAESGLPALLIFLLLLYFVVRHWLNTTQSNYPLIKYTLLIIFFGLLAIGLFDHYLWTIQQGSILFWTVLGLLSAKNRLNANAQPVILPSYN